MPAQTWGLDFVRTLFAKGEVEIALADRGLSDFQLELLQKGFLQSGTYDRLRANHPGDELIWRDVCLGWCRDVASITVDIQRGPWAILRLPGTASQVEIDFKIDPKKRIHVEAYRVVADTFLDQVLSLPDIDYYLTAFNVHFVSGQISKRWLSRIPRKLPDPGKPLDLDFYRRVFDGFEALKAQGRRDPAIELARRMNVNHSTMKSYLRRARIYLNERDS